MCSVLASQTSAHNAQAQSVKCVKCVRPCAFRSDGPLTQSLGGSQYILVVLNDASRFSWIECIEYKSDAASSLIATIKLWECETQSKVRVVRSDGGKEFCNHTMNSFFRSNGIQHQVTVRYTPEQNGRVERLNRDLMDKARAMMFQCGAPVKLWAEAVATANRVGNVILHLGKTKTPFELFYGQNLIYLDCEYLAAQHMCMCQKRNARS